MKIRIFLILAAIFFAVSAYAEGEKTEISVVLSPVVIRAAQAPAYLSSDFNNWLENGLLNNGVKTQFRKSVSGGPEKNGKSPERRLLLQAEVSRFEILQIPYYVEETGAQGYRHVGNIGGYIRVVSAPDGNTVGSIPFEQQVLFGNSSNPENRNSTFEDYGKFMIKSVIAGKIVPELLKVPGVKEK